MKKIAMLLIFITQVSYANSIPGWIELDISAGRYYDFYGDSNVLYKKHNIGTSLMRFRYGVDFEWINPYIYGEVKTFYTYSNENQKRNCPFRDNYSFGTGIEIKKFFYLEYEHRCSHSVFSMRNSGIVMIDQKIYNYYEGLPTLSYDMFKIGIRFKID